MDISSDRRNNSEISPNFVRNDVVKRGFTINGLAIINEWPLHDEITQDMATMPGRPIPLADIQRTSLH
jgi:hypothetical protein